MFNIITNLLKGYLCFDRDKTSWYYVASDVKISNTFKLHTVYCGHDLIVPCQSCTIPVRGKGGRHHSNVNIVGARVHTHTRSRTHTLTHTRAHTHTHTLTLRSNLFSHVCWLFEWMPMLNGRQLQTPCWVHWGDMAQ